MNRRLGETERAVDAVLASLRQTFAGADPATAERIRALPEPFRPATPAAPLRIDRPPSPPAPPPAFPLPRDPGCGCGQRTGICAPQRPLTHAAYAQVIKARVAAHRIAAEHAARVATHDAGAGPEASGAEGVGAHESRERRIADSPVAHVFDTVERPPERADRRQVRRSAVFYRGGVFVDVRAVGGTRRRNREWREVARRDAKAVSARLARCGLGRLREVVNEIDRRGMPGCDRVVRAEAVCWAMRNGKREPTAGAYCVSFVDDKGETQAGMIYMPIDGEDE